MRCLPIRATLRAAALSPCVVVLLSAQSSVPDPAPARIQPGTLPSTETDPDLPLATPLSVATPSSTPLDFHGKLNYFLRSTGSPATLARVGLTTGFAHLAFGAGDWGGGADGFADRMQSRYAEHVTRRGVQFAVGALRGEDPRFFRSNKDGFWDRTKFVLSRTVLTQMDDSSTGIAVGRLTGYAVGNFASAYWHPANPTPWKHTLTGTGVNLGGDLAMRMLREFWPDVTRKFRH